MEADEIRVVLESASELHGKFNEAIERALKSDFLQSSSGGILDSDFASALDGDEINGMESFNREFIKAAGKDGISNAEARTLGLIRDALEALEEQLQALQVGCSISTSCFCTLEFHVFLAEFVTWVFYSDFYRLIYVQFLLVS